MSLRTKYTVALERYRLLLPRYNLSYKRMYGRHGDYTLRYVTYANCLIDELINEINAHTAENPLRIVQKTQTYFDDILSQSAEEAFGVHQFAGIMDHIVSDIIRYLEENV